MRIHNKVIAACISIVVWLLATSAAADSPTVEIKSTVDQVIKLLTDPRLSGESNKQERRRLLRKHPVVGHDLVHGVEVGSSDRDRGRPSRHRGTMMRPILLASVPNQIDRVG